MTHVVNAVPRQEVKKSTTIGCKKLNPHAARVAHVHLQKVQQPNSLRIHMIRVKIPGYGNGLRLSHISLFICKCNKSPGFSIRCSMESGSS